MRNDTWLHTKRLQRIRNEFSDGNGRTNLKYFNALALNHNKSISSFVYSKKKENSMKKGKIKELCGQDPYEIDSEANSKCYISRNTTHESSHEIQTYTEHTKLWLR